MSQSVAGEYQSQPAGMLVQNHIPNYGVNVE
jgi:hypothetical protein